MTSISATALAGAERERSLLARRTGAAGAGELSDRRSEHRRDDGDRAAARARKPVGRDHRLRRCGGDGGDAGAEPREHRCAQPHAAHVLHVHHGARRVDGAGVHDLLHHGVRLRHRAPRGGAHSLARILDGDVLARRRRHAHGGNPDPHLQGERALHVLPAAPGAPRLLHRPHARRRRVVGMVGERRGDVVVAAPRRPRRAR